VAADDQKTSRNSFYFKDCFGILEAANVDYTDGFLFQIRNLVRAELLDDFLDQADALLRQNYHVSMHHSFTELARQFVRACQPPRPK
jgi:hypothetical protein